MKHNKTYVENVIVLSQDIIDHNSIQELNETVFVRNFELTKTVSFNCKAGVTVLFIVK